MRVKKKSSCLLLHALGDCYIHRSVVEKTGRFLNLVKCIIFLNKYNLAKKDLKRQFSQLPRSKKKYTQEGQFCVSIKIRELLISASKSLKKKIQK